MSDQDCKLHELRSDEATLTKLADSNTTLRLSPEEIAQAQAIEAETPSGSYPKKALVSPDFGAGWSTWASSDREEFYLYDEALIAAIEQNGCVTDEALQDFERREQEQFGDTDYKGGARSLVVKIAHSPFRVHEYDGSEHLEFRDEIKWH